MSPNGIMSPNVLSLQKLRYRKEYSLKLCAPTTTKNGLTRLMDCQLPQKRLQMKLSNEPLDICLVGIRKNYVSKRLGKKHEMLEMPAPTTFAKIGVVGRPTLSEIGIDPVFPGHPALSRKLNAGRPGKTPILARAPSHGGRWHGHRPCPGIVPCWRRPCPGIVPCWAHRPGRTVPIA